MIQNHTDQLWEYHFVLLEYELNQAQTSTFFGICSQSWQILQAIPQSLLFKRGHGIIMRQMNYTTFMDSFSELISIQMLNKLCSAASWLTTEMLASEGPAVSASGGDWLWVVWSQQDTELWQKSDSQRWLNYFHVYSPVCEHSEIPSKPSQHRKVPCYNKNWLLCVEESPGIWPGYLEPQKCTDWKGHRKGHERNACWFCSTLVFLFLSGVCLPLHLYLLESLIIHWSSYLH